ncbi:MAG: hypothetical protein RL719_777, partial [Actinomycetota bacterium]
PIHAWAGETASDVAQKFDQILDGVMIDLVENPHIEITSKSKRKARKANKLNRSKRGSIDTLLGVDEGEKLEALELLTGEIELPAPFEEAVADFSAELAEEAQEVQVEALQPAALQVEVEAEDTLPLTPEQLFDNLLQETQKKFAQEREEQNNA